MTARLSLAFIWLLATVVLFLPAYSAASEKWLRYDRKLTAAEERWVEATLKKMSLEEKVGQMFLAEANATFMSRDSKAYQQLLHQIRDNKVGGIILFRSDVWATAVLTNRMQTESKLPLLISSDLEMGLGMRLNETPWWQPNMAVAATGDPSLARLQGEYTAREARSIGINWLYAPVADVNNNPDNPVINVRSYGEDPEKVASFVSEFVKGAQEAGAIACVKHFPGHGDTATDSHIGLPVVNVSRDRLERIELVPFKAAIKAGVGSVMSAHISLPQIETDPVAPLRKLSSTERDSAEYQSLTESKSGVIGKPATLSNKILTGILRTDLGFKGLVASDAMSMAGIAARYDTAAASVEAVKAGIDVIEKSPDIDAGIRGVVDAVKRNEIPVSRIEASVRRILRAKALLGLIQKRTVDIDQVDAMVSSNKSMEAARLIAEKSITLVRDDARMLPLKTGAATKLLNITFAENEQTFNIQPFVGELRKSVQVDSLTLEQKSGESLLKQALDKADRGGYDAVIFSTTVRALSGKGSIALQGIGLKLAEELMKRKLPLVVISFGNPYLLTAMPTAKTYLACYSPFPVAQEAAARGLLGQIDITGKLPVGIPGLYPAGQGIQIKALQKRP